MTIIKHTLEFTTPCFCAGADQARAEVRAPSVRGQLRWWFRALGGNRADEAALFGGVHGSATASALQVRIREVSRAAPWNPPRVYPNAPSSYVWYFASVSGKVPGQQGPGPRWKSQGAIPPGTRIELQLTMLRPVDSAIQKRFEKALCCFLLVGGLGLRLTRGLGAFRCLTNPPDVGEVRLILVEANFAVEIRSHGLKDVNELAQRIGSLAKGTRSVKKMKSSQPSPFGSSTPRQASSIQFRPVLAANGSGFDLWVLQAPSDRVLAPASRRGVIVGHKPTNLTDG